MAERDILALFNKAAEEIAEEKGLDKDIVNNTMIKLIYQIVRI